MCSEQKYPHSVPKEAIALKLRTRSLRIRHHFILSGKSDLMYLMAVRPPLTISSFFFDAHVINRIIRSTTSYAEHKKGGKKSRYEHFVKKPLTHAEVMAFLGV